MIEAGKRLLPVEVKAAARVTSREASTLLEFIADYSRECKFGVLLYGGTEIRMLTESVIAVPITVAL